MALSPRAAGRQTDAVRRAGAGPFPEIRMRAALLAFVVAALARSATASPEEQLLAEYAANVRLYRTGEHAQAVRALAAEPAVTLDWAARAVGSARARQTLGLTGRDLEAAALLH